MEWPRVKNILIVLLVIVNVFLFIAYANSAMRDSRVEKETREHVTSVLEKRGFSMNPELIPQKGTVLYPARAARDTEGELQIAQMLLGETTSDRLGSGTVRYQSEKGEVRFRSGSFFEITLLDCEQVQNTDSMREFVRDIAKKLEMQINSQEIPVEEEAESYRASIVQTIIGVPIYNCRLSIWVLPDHSAKITGRMIPDQITILRGQEPYAISGLLLNLIEELNVQGITSGTIEELSPGYRIGTSAGSGQSGTVYAIPIWKIRVSGTEYYMNAMNGKAVYID